MLGLELGLSILRVAKLFPFFFGCIFVHKTKADEEHQVKIHPDILTFFTVNRSFSIKFYLIYKE